LQIDEIELARQITLFDFNLFSNILSTGNFEKKKKNTQIK